MLNTQIGLHLGAQIAQDLGAQIGLDLGAQTSLEEEKLLFRAEAENVRTMH